MRTSTDTPFRLPARRFAAAALLLIVVAIAVAAWYVPRADGPALVVYCAHDSVYSTQILRQFEQQTGIRVAPRFDTEATKSLGLAELIRREKANPRCDVFWNNEQLGTVALMEQGFLEPYRGAGFDRIPAAYKDPDGHWSGFAARMRVWIVNTQKMRASAEAVREALSGDLSAVAIAEPLYGTTRTHYTVLWDLMGPEGLKAWHVDWRDRGVVEVPGNSVVKNLVAAGRCTLGLTDTDDFFLALDEGQAVAMLPVHLEDQRVICIPNTVAIVRGTKRAGEARRLVDYLLSQQTELALAHAQSRQIPLGPVDPQQLPDDVRQLKQWAENAYPLSALRRSNRDCLDWLRREYLR